ncbi:hypothetical protein Tco_0277717 [Tanacetum coccineum]
MLIWRPCDAGIINIYWKNHYVDNAESGRMVESDIDLPLQPPQERTQAFPTSIVAGIILYLGELLPFNYSTDIISNDHRFGVPVRRAWAPSLRMSFYQRHQKLLQLLPSGGKRKYTPHSEGLNKLCDNCVHNISQCTPTHKFRHGPASNEMTEIVSKPLIVREIAETNGNTVNIVARTVNVKTSILTHSQHPHCLTSKRIQFPTTVSRLCPIIKLAHLLFGTRKIPIHAYPRLCIVLSCTTLLKAVYRGGKTTPTTGGGSNEFSRVAVMVSGRMEGWQCVSIARLSNLHDRRRHINYSEPNLLRKTCIWVMEVEHKLPVVNNNGTISATSVIIRKQRVLQRITSLKCVLTQEHLDAICAKYFVPEEVHPQLPSSDATMHERPTGKVGMYTRFFDYANYRIPFSTFFVSVLTHFRIPFSQLSVFGSAKVSHFEILCRVCNIEPDVSLFRYFYTHNYKNGWFGFTKRPNVRACYSKNLDSVKNWNDHFFWVDEFVVPANARFSWFSGSNIVKDRAPAPSEYNVEHINTLIAQASPFLRFPEEFLCWVGISRNYLLNKDTYPRFEYEDGEGMDLNAFIRTADPRKVRIVERPRAENERPIVTVAKHRTVTLLPTSVVRSSGELSASVEREFVGDASVGDGGDQGFDSVAGQDNVEPSVPVTEPVEAEVPKPKRSKKKRVIYDSEGLPVASHPPKRLRADYGTTGGSVTGASPLEEGGDRTDSVTGPSLRTIGPSARFVVLSDSSHHSGAKSADPEVDSLVRSAAPVMTEAITVATIAITVAIPADVSKDKSAPHPSVFGSSSSYEKTDRTLSLFTGRSVSGFDAGSIRAEGAVGAGSKEIYVPEWMVTKGFEMNDRRLCANMIDHFTPPAFFKTVHGMEHEQLFTEAREESAEVTQLRAQVSGLEATENSLRGEVASAKDRNTLLEQECDSLKLKVTGLESAIVDKI